MKKQTNDHRKDIKIVFYSFFDELNRGKLGFEIDNLKEKFSSLRENINDIYRNVLLLEEVWGAIVSVKSHRANTSNYEKDFLSLAKIVYLKNTPHTFMLFLKYPTKDNKKDFENSLKKAFSLGITNDELNTNLVYLIKNSINKDCLIKTKILQDKLEFNIPINQNNFNYYCDQITFWENKLKEVEKNPIDFTKFLDDKASSA